MLKSIVYRTRTQRCRVFAALHVAYVFSLYSEYSAYIVVSVSHGSTDVLEHILSHESCDVDPQDFQGDTPLHYAVRAACNPADGEPADVGLSFIDTLLDAGADTTYAVAHTGALYGANVVLE